MVIFVSGHWISGLNPIEKQQLLASSLSFGNCYNFHSKETFNTSKSLQWTYHTGAVYGMCQVMKADVNTTHRCFQVYTNICVLFGSYLETSWPIFWCRSVIFMMAIYVNLQWFWNCGDLEISIFYYSRCEQAEYM